MCLYSKPAHEIVATTSSWFHPLFVRESDRYVLCCYFGVGFNWFHSRIYFLFEKHKDLVGYYTELNELIFRENKQTLFTFLKLPDLPDFVELEEQGNDDKEEIAANYVKAIHAVTANLSPTALVQTGELINAIATAIWPKKFPGHFSEMGCDSFCSYSTNRMVVIRDWKLGCLYNVLLLATSAYIFYYVFYLNQVPSALVRFLKKTCWSKVIFSIFSGRYSMRFLSNMLFAHKLLWKLTNASYVIEASDEWIPFEIVFDPDPRILSFFRFATQRYSLPHVTSSILVPQRLLWEPQKLYSIPTKYHQFTDSPVPNTNTKVWPSTFLVIIALWDAFVHKVESSGSFCFWWWMVIWLLVTGMQGADSDFCIVEAYLRRVPVKGEYRFKLIPHESTADFSSLPYCKESLSSLFETRQDILAFPKLGPTMHSMHQCKLRYLRL